MSLSSTLVKIVVIWCSVSWLHLILSELICNSFESLIRHLQLRYEIFVDYIWLNCSLKKTPFIVGIFYYFTVNSVFIDDFKYFFLQLFLIRFWVFVYLLQYTGRETYGTPKETSLTRERREKQENQIEWLQRTEQTGEFSVAKIST